MDEKMECTAHEWKAIRETDYGEMDYSSYGGGVNHFVVTLYHCARCGAVRKEYTGDFNGDPSPYLEVTEEDIRLAEEAEAEARSEKHGFMTRLKRRLSGKR